MAAFNPLQNYLGGLNAGQQQVDRQAQLARDAEKDKYDKMKRFNNLSEDRKKAYFDDMVIGKSLLENNDLTGFGSLIENRKKELKRLGSNDTTGTEMIIDLFNNRDIQGISSILDTGINAGRQLGYIKDTGTAEQREFKDLTDGLSDTEKALAKRIKLGLSPRAVGSSAQTISQDQGLTNQVAQSEAVITGAKEGAKLMEEFKLKPKIAYEVGLSTARAAEIADTDKESRSNNKALNVFETGMRSLVDAFDEGGTGAIVGRLPALTSDQQKMDGAISLMAPLVKQVFRSAGEGVFTDKDQELLMGMLPTRKDNKETVDFKIKNIYEIINQKLGQQGAQPSPQPSSGFKILSVN